ncbi:M20 family metallopeptidase [Proteiniclasticum sp. QWL-01]|uniref:M20 family metallopeptidase n=1 Tax=Proteiniclasticum sp. QWL-01 TaxID=3036945 RepID=UPI0024102940|nr:M20 family metallopeptidase [Proteiniclasticum sp. QWL-01]WFF72966.1 M20 family metallopeptidase [Proteiniclasticum sp. QWL-01]
MSRTLDDHLTRQVLPDLMPDLIRLSRFVYDHPELGLEEVESSRAHIELLEKYGFTVEQPFKGLATAFCATFDTGRPGRTVAFLSEYDALPGLGHGCGHNILGAATTGSGIAASRLIEQGRIQVFGTPAEETVGSKVTLTRAGAFQQVDAALCTHPDRAWYQSGTTMAMESIRFVYRGKPAHAASHPEEGINALDSIILLFNSIALLRQQLHETVRIHGIITKGGEAANIIPDHCEAEFYVRARTQNELEGVSARVRQAAQGAALATGAVLSMEQFEEPYQDLVTNQTMSARFNQIMADQGIVMVSDPSNPGSMDMGDVSHAVPTINPFFAIDESGTCNTHTPEFRDATLTPYANQSMERIIRGLSQTAQALIAEDAFFEEVHREFLAAGFQRT